MKAKKYVEELIEKQIEVLNKLHDQLQNKPDHLKKGYSLSPGGILNAYREGDLSFDEAVKLLQVNEAVESQIIEWAGLPVELILRCLRDIWNCLAAVSGDKKYRELYTQLGDNLHKLEEAIDLEQGGTGADQGVG